MSFNSWFMKNANLITQWGAIIIVALCIIYLTILSILVKDFKYPREHPYLFTLETILFSVGTGAIIFLMAYGREDLSSATWIEFLIISLKFGILQILLQFSGFYTYAFTPLLVKNI